MNSLIIGTAGHIDHGKTSLIKALNNFDGDNLKEEKEKGITINLSFSNLKQDDKNIAFIDVPGHESLVKTMISGAFAFSACLFIVDINEGLKEQSFEHLQVLKLLDIKNIILILSKCDLCKNIKEQEEKIINKAKTNFIKTFKISIYDEKSLKDLKNYLFKLKPISNENEFIFRYYIDRVFSLKGIGSVVSGSLNEGNIRLNEKIICLDNNKEIIIKNIQIHDKNVEYAQAFNRVALNLNIEHKFLKKGYLLSKKGYFKGFKNADCVVFSSNIKHNSFVNFCVGSKQIQAKIIILQKINDDKFFVSFEFNDFMFLEFDEKFILLQNNRVIGGGRVLNPLNEPLKKEMKIKFLKLLENKDFLKIFDFLKNVHKFGFGLLSSYQRFKLKHEQALNIAKRLKNAFVDEKNLNIYDISSLKTIQEFIIFILQKNEKAMLSAMSISNRLSWASVGFCELALKNLENILDFKNGIYFKKGISYEKLKQNNQELVFKIIKDAFITPIAPYNIYDELELDRKSGDEIFKNLTQKGLIIRLAHNIFIEKNALNYIKEECKEYLKHDFLDVQKMKDKFKISRKYAICYLEYLDKEKDIISIDEKRYLKK